MKILYGVQGTGNGHIARARAMSHAFKEHDVEVDFLFSGRVGRLPDIIQTGENGFIVDDVPSLAQCLKQIGRAHV